MGTLALTLKEESRRDLNFLSAHTVHLKFEDSLHNWHWQPHPFLEFWLNPRTKEHPECGGLTLVLFNFPNHTHWSWMISAPLGLMLSHFEYKHHPSLQTTIFECRPVITHRQPRTVANRNRENTTLFALGHGYYEMSKHLILFIEVNVKAVESLITTLWHLMHAFLKHLKLSLLLWNVRMFYSGKQSTRIEFSLCAECREVWLRCIRGTKEDTMNTGSCESVDSENNLKRLFLVLLDFRPEFMNKGEKTTHTFYACVTFIIPFSTQGEEFLPPEWGNLRNGSLSLWWSCAPSQTKAGTCWTLRPGSLQTGLRRKAGHQAQASGLFSIYIWCGYVDKIKY